jgi:hypothetical protein
MKEPAQIVCGEGPARLEGSGEPDRTGRATETPTRLEDGDFVEAVSRAVLREIEGGSIEGFIILGMVLPVCSPSLLALFNR